MVKKSASITVDGVVASNIQEGSRHFADQIDEELEKPQSQFLDMLLSEYLKQYRGDFEDKGGGQFVYVGEDGDD